MLINKRDIFSVLIIGIIILAIPIVGFAGTVANPASPNIPKGAGVFSLKQNKNVSIKTGFDLEFLFDRDIHANAATNTELTSGEWYMGSISYTLFDRFSPYVKLGVAHLKVKWTEAGKEAKLESDTNFAWGLGGKLLIWEFQKPKIKFISDGFYRVADLDGEEGRWDGSKVTLDTAKSRFLIREWQVALLAATEIDLSGPDKEDILGISKIVPYIGGKYSDINGRIRQTLTNGDYQNPGKIEAEHNYGAFVGCDLVGPNDAVLLNMEGRFIDETALTVGLLVLF